ncbi:ATP synthase F1 subunit gamma [Acetobacteraceae bacterium]|nr:ATP synthase F1 subunit gamma [Acetobacteraceae bacterium]
MSSLKALKLKIAGVKSTRKITEAMRLVAASKLYRAQQNMAGAQPYVKKMAAMMRGGASSSVEEFELPLFTGGKGNKILILAVTGNRGLAGAYNANIARHLKAEIAKNKENGQKSELYLIGKKANQILKTEFGHLIVQATEAAETLDEQEKQASEIADFVVEKVNSGEYSRILLVNNHLVNAMLQIPQVLSLVPPLPSENDESVIEESDGVDGQFEPSQQEWLEAFLPVNLKVRIYHALLANMVGVQSARMVAMDGASRNASKMIDSLSLQYNRMRQNNITRELSEIVAGAAAVGDK